MVWLNRFENEDDQQIVLEPFSGPTAVVAISVGFATTATLPSSFTLYTGFHLYYGGLCGGGGGGGGGGDVGLVGRGVGVGTCMRLWRVQLGHPWDNG